MQRGMTLVLSSEVFPHRWITWYKEERGQAQTRTTSTAKPPAQNPPPPHWATAPRISWATSKTSSARRMSHRETKPSQPLTPRT